MHTSPVHRQFADKGLVIPMTTRLSTKLSSKKHRRLAHEGASRRRQSSVWHNASHRFRRLLRSGVPPPNKHGLRLPAVNGNEFHSSPPQEFPPGHRSPCPFTPVKELGDFLLATRSLSFEFQTPRSTNRGTALPGRPQKRFLRYSVSSCLESRG